MDLSVRKLKTSSGTKHIYCNIIERVTVVIYLMYAFFDEIWLIKAVKVKCSWDIQMPVCENRMYPEMHSKETLREEQ